MARTIPALAFFDRYIEKDCFDVAPVVFSEHHVGPALIRRQVCCVDERDGTAQFQPMLQQFAQNMENAAMNVLVGRIVGKQAPDFVAR